MNERTGKSSKTMVAGVLVVFLLAAFGAAFYLLGGAGLVTGLLAGSPQTAAKPQTVATTAKPKPAAKPKQQATATTTPGANPAPAADPSASGSLSAVDETFAKRMFIEQVESNENIQKLAAGKVIRFRMGKPLQKQGGLTEVPLIVTFDDHSSAPGMLGMRQSGGNWFLAYAGGMRTKSRGEANSVAAGSSEASLSDAEQVAGYSGTIDTDVMNTIVSAQQNSQTILQALATGAYSEMKLEKATAGAGTSTLTVSLKGKSAVRGSLVLVRKTVDGSPMWFVTSFNKR